MEKFIMKIFGLFFVVFIFMYVEVAESTDKLTPIKIFNYFPLCKLNSSYGQRCKTFSFEKKNKFAPSQMQDIKRVFVKGNRLEIVSRGWFYLFLIEHKSDGRFTIKFVDDATEGTYFVSENYDVKWDKKRQNWTIVGYKLNYISGNTEDKNRVGKYYSFSKPVYFVGSEKE